MDENAGHVSVASFQMFLTCSRAEIGHTTCSWITKSFNNPDWRQDGWGNIDMMDGACGRCDQMIGINYFLRILSRASAKICANGCKENDVMQEYKEKNKWICVSTGSGYV